MVTPSGIRPFWTSTFFFITGGEENADVGLNAFGLAGNLLSVHASRQNDIGEQKIEPFALLQILQRLNSVFCLGDPVTIFLHDGHISIASEIDHGTTAELYLPASQEGMIQKETVGGTGTFARGTERIPVVEGDETIHEIPGIIISKKNN